MTAWPPHFKAVLETTLKQRRVIKTEENVTASPTKQVQEGTGVVRDTLESTAAFHSTAAIVGTGAHGTLGGPRDRSMTRVHSRGTREARQTEARPAMGSAHTPQRVTMPHGELCSPGSRHAQAGARRRDSDRGGGTDCHLLSQQICTESSVPGAGKTAACRHSPFPWHSEGRG